MRSAIIKHFLVLAVGLSVVSPGLSYNNGRIVGGTEVGPGEYDFTVALYMNVSGEVKYHCGAALLSPYHAITAAHCVTGWYPERFYIVAGTTDLVNTEPTMAIVHVEEMAVHDLFHFEVDSAIPTNDIAILKLTESLPQFSYVTLPEQEADVPVGSVCTVLGWGATQDGGPVSTKLMQAEVPVQDQELCFESFSGVQFRPSMICAGYSEGGIDACQGDSGGPLICDGVLHGLVSWGDGCAEPNKYGVYTRVPLFSDWLEKHNFVLNYPTYD